MANSGNDGALESFLDEWVTLVSGCTPENEFCDNAEGLAIVEKEPTGPYLPEWMICSAHPDTGLLRSPGYGVASRPVADGGTPTVCRTSTPSKTARVTRREI